MKRTLLRDILSVINGFMFALIAYNLMTIANSYRGVTTTQYETAPIVVTPSDDKPDPVPELVTVVGSITFHTSDGLNTFLGYEVIDTQGKMWVISDDQCPRGVKNDTMLIKLTVRGHTYYRPVSLW